MDRRISGSIAGLVVMLVVLAFLSYGIRTTANTAAVAIYGIGAALVAGATVWPLGVLTYAAFNAPSPAGIAAIRQQCRMQLFVLVGLLAAMDVWPIFDLLVFPSERAIVLGILRLIQICGVIVFVGIIYWRFRSERIQANPDRSTEIRKKFYKWERVFGNLLYAVVLVPSLYFNARDEISLGHTWTLLLWGIFFLAVLAVSIILRLKIEKAKRA